MNLPAPGQIYDGQDEAQARAEIQREDARNIKKGGAAGNITYLQTGTGATARPIVDRLAEMPSAKDFNGVVGDGVANDTLGLQNWLTAITGKAGFLPAGTFIFDTSLTVPIATTIYGIPAASLLRPSAGVTTAAVVQSVGSTLQGVNIIGTDTTNIIGLSIGTTGLSGGVANNGFTRQVQVKNFTGASGTALQVKAGVIWVFDGNYFGDGTNGTNIIDSGNGTPTTLTFLCTVFKGNSQIGMQLMTGQECQFYSCVFEQNGSLGTYCNVAAGGGGNAAVQNILFQACYWEANQTGTASGALRHALYHAYARGEGIKFRDCFFANGAAHASFTSEARAIQFDQAVDCLVDHCSVANEAGQINLIGGSSAVQFTNWPVSNGTISSTVLVTAGTATKYAPIAL